PTSLQVAALPDAADLASAGLAMGAPVGLLGLDLTNRRRNRANGIVRALDARGFTVAVTQSFGNCAQYIQTRHPSPRAALPGAPIEPLSRLDDDATRLIAGADTFFVAS